MSRFIATTFNFDTTIIDADGAEEAFDFMVGKFGIFSDPIVRLSYYGGCPEVWGKEYPVCGC